MLNSVRKHRFFIVMGTIVMLLSACSSVPIQDDPLQAEMRAEANTQQHIDNHSINATEVTLATVKAELDAYKAQWQQAKPSIERLTALEQDLQLLIQELSKASDIDNSPVEELAPQNEKILSEIELEQIEFKEQQARMAAQQEKHEANFKDGIKVIHDYPIAADGSDTRKQITKDGVAKKESKQNLAPKAYKDGVVVQERKLSSKQDKVYKDGVAVDAKVKQASAVNSLDNIDMAVAENSDIKINRLTPESPIVENTVKTQAESTSVHLATFSIKQKLKAVWLGIQKRYPQHFTGKQPMSEMINKDNINLYRLKVAFFTQGQAQQICQQLKQHQQYCKVSNSQGELL